MGNLLDKPCKEKEMETGIGMGMPYAIGAMQGWRRSMEDAHLASFVAKHGPEPVALFGVYDGHGGKEVSIRVAKEFVGVFNKQKESADAGEALRETYVALDKDMLKAAGGMTMFSQVGCTAITCAIQGSSVYFANAGDSRGLIGTRQGQVRVATHDHKPNSPRERKRIYDAGGTVDLISGQHRVSGNLNLSRALGDLKYKLAMESTGPERQIISGYPDILSTELQEDDEFLILACDGIWDVLTNEECLAFVQNFLEDGPHSEQKLKKCAEALLERCCSPDCSVNALGTDNMTVVIVSLRNRVGGGAKDAEGRPILKFNLSVPCSDVEVYSTTDSSCSSESLTTSFSNSVGSRSSPTSTSRPGRGGLVSASCGEANLVDELESSVFAASGADVHKLLVVLKRKNKPAERRFMLLPEPARKLVYQRDGHQLLVYT
ncbi:unnamed protein product [Amoebophrya sp. A25]|nr:unnamed protein product [Amoebophrya sp. A25]|eukprot:GSA25T00000948001.1